MCRINPGGLYVGVQPEKRGKFLWGTHLSNTPSVPPTLLGPTNTIQCSIDMRPDSQGMRRSSSTSRDAQLHSFMLTMGRFNASGRLAAGCAACGSCDWRFASTGD